MDLNDTPNDYAGNALKFVRVNTTATALEFATGAEVFSHSDLIDMPDVLGTNSDHDARYVKKSGDTMTGDLTIISAITEKPVLTLQNTILGGDTPYLNITNVNGTLSLYVNADGTGVIDGSGGRPLYLGNPSQFLSGGGGNSDLGSLTDKWKNLFLSESVVINPLGTITPSDITVELNATDTGYGPIFGGFFYSAPESGVHSGVGLVERGMGNAITAVGNVSIEGVDAIGSPLGQIAALTIVQSRADYGIHLTGDATIVGVTTGTNFVSIALTDTQPFACTSTTLNTNLNADLWDGYQFADYLNQAVKTTSSPIFDDLTVTDLFTYLQSKESSLVGFYQFNANANDSSGNSYNGTTNAEVTYTDGILNSAISSGGVSLDSYVAYFGFDEITLSAWFKFYDDTVNPGYLFSVSHTAENTSYWAIGVIDPVTYAQKLYFRIIENNVQIVRWNSTATYNDNLWHHVVFRTGTSGTKIFIDGIVDAGTYLAGSSATAAGFSKVLTPNAVTIAAKKQLSAPTFTRGWAGNLDDLKIYSRYLNDGETIFLYKQGFGFNVFNLLKAQNIGFNVSPSTSYRAYWKEAETTPLTMIYQDLDVRDNILATGKYNVIDFLTDVGGTNNLWYVYGNQRGLGTLRGFYSKVEDSDGTGFNRTAYHGYADTGDGTNNLGYAFYNELGHMLVAGDNYEARFGTGLAAIIKYDASDMIVQPDKVGTGRFIVDTGTAIGQEAVMIQQDDADKAFLNWQGTSATDATKNITTRTVATIKGYVLVEVNGTTGWMAIYNTPTA